MPIKNRLKGIRMKEYMLNSKEFSKLIGVKLSTYSQWENGVNTPSVEKSFEIAKILNKQITEIWCEE